MRSYSASKPRGERLGEQFLHGLPAGPFMCDENEGVLYVGRAPSEQAIVPFPEMLVLNYTR